MASVHGLAEHFPLLWRNGCADEHTASFATCQPIFTKSGIVFVSIAVMYDYRHLVGDVEQKSVTYDLAVSSSYLHIVEHCEKLRIVAFYIKASWIVVKVCLLIVKLIVVNKNLVVVSRFEKSFSWSFVDVEQSPVCSVASSLESGYYLAKVLVLGHVLVYSHDNMDMIGHNTYLPYFNHRVIQMNLLYLLIKDTLAQNREFNIRSVF